MINNLYATTRPTGQIDPDALRLAMERRRSPQIWPVRYQIKGFWRCLRFRWWLFKVGRLDIRWRIALRGMNRLEDSA